MMVIVGWYAILTLKVQALMPTPFSCDEIGIFLITAGYFTVG